MATSQDFSGSWYFCYWAPSNQHGGEDPNEYGGSLIEKDGDLIFESLPTKAENYMFARLRLNEDGVATGTWYEESSPHGFFKGMAYSGAGQLLFDKSKMEFKGMWAGIGLDRTINEPKVYTGRWEIKRISD